MFLRPNLYMISCRYGVADKVYVGEVLMAFQTKLPKSDSQTEMNHQDLMENVQNKFII